MNVEKSACAMRADGKSIATIAEKLGISKQWAYKCAGNTPPAEPRDDANTVIHYASDVDGYRKPVRMPRIAAIDGVAA